MAILALLATAGLRVPAVIRQSWALKRARSAGLFTEPIRVDMVNNALRSEILRTVKSFICVVAIALTFTQPDAPPETANVIALRNALFAIISIGMGANSIMDEIFERRWMRVSRKQEITAAEDATDDCLQKTKIAVERKWLSRAQHK